MAEATGIAWTRSSWSPWIGCTEVSPGCKNCYAKALDDRHRYGQAVHWGPGVPRYRTKAWDAPLTWNRKAARSGERWTVFPSLCDPFDNEVSAAWHADLWALIAATPALTWLLLTKRIGNVAKLVPWVEHAWPNVWIGASVVNQEEADRDIPKLLATPAALRFVSYEPALGLVDWGAWLGPGRPAIDWLIVGGESMQPNCKPRPFDVSWARCTIAQCRGTGTPVFMKQLGSHPVEPLGSKWPVARHAYSDPLAWPLDLRVQEFPA